MQRDADQPAAADYPPDYPFAPQPDAGTSDSGPAKVELPALPESRKRTEVREVFAPWPVLVPGLLAGCGVFNLIIGPLVEAFSAPVIMVGLVYGVFLTEMSALSMWMVWSERPAWQRLVLGTLAAELLLACCLLGIVWSDPGPAGFDQVARALLCSLPLALLCVQTLLWALRIYAGWRVAADRSARASRPLSIGQILLATVVVAVAVSLVRLASDDPEFYEVAWISWAVAAPSIAGVSLISLPVALYLVLRWERPTSGLYLLWGYATVVLLVVLMTAPLAFGARITGEETVALFVTCYVFAGLLWTVLRLVRSWDYRLLTRGPEAT